VIPEVPPTVQNGGSACGYQELFRIVGCRADSVTVPPVRPTRAVYLYIATLTRTYSFAAGRVAMAG
jgi:hypothetical protein